MVCVACSLLVLLNQICHCHLTVGIAHVKPVSVKIANVFFAGTTDAGPMSLQGVTAFEYRPAHVIHEICLPVQDTAEKTAGHTGGGFYSTDGECPAPPPKQSSKAINLISE